MLISDLPSPVTASKADWLPGTHWLGFTPTGTSAGAAAQCQTTINRQFGAGYVVEYITEQFAKPNPGFERAEAYLKAREEHEERAGRLIAVHRLLTTSRPLIEIVGPAEFNQIQDMWSQNDDRNRWSVAFPIVESYHVRARPKAKKVFGEALYRSIYGRSSAVLRELSVEAQEALQHLELDQARTLNAWISIEDDFEKAERSEVSGSSLSKMTKDLASALEGETTERRAKLTRRAAWLADSFIRERRKSNRLRCDHCAFDPTIRTDLIGMPARSLLDVHHLNPLAEGKRITGMSDLALLCPTCHRIEHARLKASSKK